MNTAERIIEECDALKALLLEKNKKYDDSAINPKRIFSTADSAEQIKVRLDDKLSRIINARETGTPDTEDAVQDLLGYLILLRVAQKVQTEKTRETFEKDRAVYASK